MTRLEIIAAEVNGDPQNIGYMDPVNDDGVERPPTTPEIAERLNDPALSGQTVAVASATSGEIKSAIDWGEYRSVAIQTHARKPTVEFILASATVHITPTVQSEILGLFTAQNAPLTRAALIAKFARPASRAEILGLGHVSTQEVGLALNR